MALLRSPSVDLTAVVLEESVFLSVFTYPKSHLYLRTKTKKLNTLYCANISNYCPFSLSSQPSFQEQYSCSIVGLVECSHFQTVLSQLSQNVKSTASYYQVIHMIDVPQYCSILVSYSNLNSKAKYEDLYLIHFCIAYMI